MILRSSPSLGHVFPLSHPAVTEPMCPRHQAPAAQIPAAPLTHPSGPCQGCLMWPQGGNSLFREGDTTLVSQHSLRYQGGVSGHPQDTAGSLKGILCLSLIDSPLSHSLSHRACAQLDQYETVGPRTGPASLLSPVSPQPSWPRAGHSLGFRASRAMRSLREVGPLLGIMSGSLG